MKAKEYFDKYENRIMDPNITDEEYSKTAVAILMDFNDEAQSVMASRHINRGNGFVALIKEFNGKWNSLCRLFVQKYGVSPLKEDGFKAFWVKEMPMLAGLL